MEPETTFPPFSKKTQEKPKPKTIYGVDWNIWELHLGIMWEMAINRLFSTSDMMM